MITTLNQIRVYSPCSEGWVKLLRYLHKAQADDEALPILTILESNGLDDALWCLRAVEGKDKEIRLYAVWCARQVQHLTTDPRVEACITATEAYAHNKISVQELVTSREELSRGRKCTRSTQDLVVDTVLAAAKGLSQAAAAAAARNAASLAAATLSWAAAIAASDAATPRRDAVTAWSTASAVAHAAAREAQKQKLIEICGH